MGIVVVVLVVVVVVGVVVVVWMFNESKDSLNMAMVVTCSVVSSSCISYIGIGEGVDVGVGGGVGGVVGVGVGAVAEDRTVAEAMTGDITVFALGRYACGRGGPTGLLLKWLLERLDCEEKFESSKSDV